MSNQSARRRVDALFAIVGRAGATADNSLAECSIVELAFLARGAVPDSVPAYQQAVANGVETLTDEQWLQLVEMLRERC